MAILAGLTRLPRLKALAATETDVVEQGGGGGSGWDPIWRYISVGFIGLAVKATWDFLRGVPRPRKACLTNEEIRKIVDLHLSKQHGYGYLEERLAGIEFRHDEALGSLQAQMQAHQQALRQVGEAVRRMEHRQQGAD